MISVAWPLLLVAALFLFIGIYFILGKNSVTDGQTARREQVNRLRPKNRQLPPSGVTPNRIAGAGIGLSVVGVLFLVLFVVDLFR